MKPKGTQFSSVPGHPGDVSPEPGTTPVPEGMMRFHHYTSSPEAAQSIKQQGLLRSKGEESYARGGTESPEVFMTAGVPNSDYRHSKVFVEGHVHPGTFREGGQLGIGSYGGERGGIEEHVKRMEGQRNTITALGDVPASQIMHVHEPWHENARYMAADKRVRGEVFHGEHDNLASDPSYAHTYGPAIRASKTASIASIMLGGGV